MHVGALNCLVLDIAEHKWSLVVMTNEFAASFFSFPAFIFLLFSFFATLHSVILEGYPKRTPGSIPAFEFFQAYHETLS